MDTKEKIAVMQAYMDGKAIQIKIGNVWEDIAFSEPTWNWHQDNYRIKPEAKVRPYTFEEFLMAQKEHGMYLRWKNTEHNNLYLPYGISDTGVSFSPNGISHTYEDLLYAYTWQDNSPCGTVEE